MAARRTFYCNIKTGQTTLATTNTDKNRYKDHTTALQWCRDGADVAIIDAETGEIILIWEH